MNVGYSQSGVFSWDKWDGKYNLYLINNNFLKFTFVDNHHLELIPLVKLVSSITSF